jgi:Ctr copper transporter family
MIFISTVSFYPRVLRAALYGSQIFVSFFLMLVFMTYNVGPPTCSRQLSADDPTGLFNPQKHALLERTQCKWLHVSVDTVKTLRKATDRMQAARIAERRATFGVYCCR